MAVLKSGDSTDQAHVTPAKALLVDGSSVVQPVSISGTLPASVTQGGNTAVVDATGDLQVDVNNFPTAGASEGLTGSAVPTDATYIGGNKGGSLTGINLDANGNLNINISDVGGNVAAAKGVQAVAAVPTQDFKDSGRTYVILYVDRIAGATTEALMNMSINKNGVLTTATSYTVSPGKIFRIQSINAEILNTTTVANRVLIRARVAAPVLVTSPVVAMAAAFSQAALATAGDTDPHAFPDGLEISAGQQIGMSQLCTVTTAGVVSAILVGYEY